MSRKYKFHNKGGLYFVSFATVYWLDVFTREEYFDKVVESIKFCQHNKGMEVYARCIMTNHVHLIFKAKEENPSELMRALKTYTSNSLQKLIEENKQEGRSEWLLWMMERAATKSANVKHRQFWCQDNKPIELWSSTVIDQKLEYIHMNPVVAGFVSEPEHWRYSSAIDFANKKGLIELSEL
jgi:REP element-mobilizing transposase RayT